MKGHFEPHTAIAKLRISCAVNKHHAELGYRAIDGMKRCFACKVSLPVADFSKRKSKIDGLRANCRSCEKKKFSEFYETNAWKLLEKSRERSSIWRQENPEMAKRQYDEWQERFPDHAKFLARKHGAVQSRNLYDAYVKHVIIGRTSRVQLSAIDISPDLIKLKRAELLLGRKLKEFK